MPTAASVPYYCLCPGCDQLLFRIEHGTGNYLDQAAPFETGQYGKSMVRPKCKNEALMAGEEGGPWVPASCVQRD